jgi:hypothetical protein
MEENNIVKYEGGLIKRISNQIGVTNKFGIIGASINSLSES